MIHDTLEHMARVTASTGLVMRELRLHPDDLADLRRECLARPTYPAGGGGDEFAGVRIVEDAKAPRLPRKS